MNKQSPPELMLVSASKPVDPPADAPADCVRSPIAEPISVGEAESRRCGAQGQPPGRAPVSSFAALVAGLEARERAKREAEDAAADWRWWVDPQNEEAIICRQQLALAVYVASRGDICIRQEDLGSKDGDDISVFIRPEHVPALIKRLQQLIKE